MNIRQTLLAAALVAMAGAASAATTWTDWTSSSASGATGTLGSTTVTFSGLTYGPATQTNGAGTDFWTSGALDPYAVTGRPTGTDIIALVGGGNNTTYTLTFSEAVTNPYFAGLSLGQPSLFVTYAFDATPTLVSSGAGYWGGCATCLQVSGNSMIGNEGHGVVQFMGTFTSISWTIPNAETWHGFTVGATVNPVPEPQTYALLLAGLGAVGYMARRRKG